MPHRVLLVDDDEGFRYACAKVIAGAGYLVEEAPDYQKALAILEDWEPLSLLITDLVMPPVNGFALVRMAHMRRRKLKVLYLTGYDVPTHEATAKVLRKPIDDETLLTEIRRTLSGGG